MESDAKLLLDREGEPKNNDVTDLLKTERPETEKV